MWPKGYNHNTARAAFTLIELLIVITLIIVLYGVFIQKLQSLSSPKNRPITLSSLKTTLLDAPEAKRKEILCFEPCGECQIYLDKKVASDAKIPLFTTTPILYRLNRYGELINFEFAPMLDEQGKERSVCFKYQLINNLGSSEYALLYNKRYYLYDGYNLEPTVVDTLAEARAFFNRESLLPLEQRDYNF